MHVGQNLRVWVEACTNEKHTAIGRKLVNGKCVYVHPAGRFARVQVEAGYIVTIYPSRRAGQKDYQT